MLEYPLNLLLWLYIMGAQAFVAAAADWPLWDSDTHPHEPAGSGQYRTTTLH